MRVHAALPDRRGKRRPRGCGAGRTRAARLGPVGGRAARQRPVRRLRRTGGAVFHRAFHTLHRGLLAPARASGATATPPRRPASACVSLCDAAAAGGGVVHGARQPALTAVMERLGMRRRAGEDFEHPRLPPGHPLRPTCSTGWRGRTSLARRRAANASCPAVATRCSVRARGMPRGLTTRGGCVARRCASARRCRSTAPASTDCARCRLQAGVRKISAHPARCATMRARPLHRRALPNLRCRSSLGQPRCRNGNEAAQSVD